MDDASRPLVGWRELAEAIPGGVGIQRGTKFVYVSEALAETVGVERAALVGEPWQALFDSAEAARLEGEAVERVRTDGRWEGVARTGGDDADVTAVELTLSGTDNDDVVWAVSGRASGDGDPGDVEARTSAEEPRARHAGEPRTPDAEPPRARGSKLHGRPAFVRTILDVVDDVLYVIDEDGETVLWNEQLVETTGYGHEEIDAMHASELVPPDHHEHVPDLRAAIDAPGDRRVDVDVLAKDGERITHEFSGTTFEDPETGERFRCGIARDVTDRRERERELRRYETIVETVDDGIYALDEDLRFAFVNEGLCELTGRSHEELLGLDGRKLFSDDDELAVADEIRERVVEGDTGTGTIHGTLPTRDGERIVESRYQLHPEPDGRFRGSVGVARDVTERERREAELERQRDELATLDGINELLLETVRELVQTVSRDAVERVVCERLAASDRYQFVWIGERELDGDRIVPRTTAGDANALEARATDGESETGRGPAERAMATGAVQVATVGDPAFDPWRDAASEGGVESVAAAPLQDDGAVYGVLVVCATSEDAFTEREQAGFDVLGRTVGSVVHAARSRELLFADAVVELEFRLGDDDPVFARTAGELDCELALEGYVASGERWILYLGVDGAPPDAVIEAVSGDRRVERARVLVRDGATGQVELVVTGSALLHAATTAGASVRAAAADPDGTRLTVEAPADAEVAAVVDHVQGELPGAEFLARRERDREPTAVGRPGGLLDELTDRQRDVLEAAYRSGYFAWPRESTAEEVAESLDLAAPTLHGHLRKAEELILTALHDQ